MRKAFLRGRMPLCFAVTLLLCFLAHSAPALSASTEPGYRPFSFGKKMGWFSSDGNLAIAPVFDQYGILTPPWVNLVTAAKQKGKWGLINASGSWIFPPQLDDMDSPDTRGVWPAKKNGKWGYLKSDGTWLIEPQYEVAWTFDGDRALVATASSAFYIDAAGAQSADQTLGKPFSFSANGLSAALCGKEKGAVTIKMTKLTYDNLMLSFDDYNCFIDKQKTKYFENRFRSVYNFTSQGLAVAANLTGGKYGLINTKGDWVAQPRYYTLVLFDGMEVARFQLAENGKYGLLHAGGKEKEEPVLEKADVGYNGMIRIMHNGKYGLVNAQGVRVVNTVLDELEVFNDVLFRVKFNGAYGLISPEGKWRLVPYFTELARCNEGLAAAKFKDMWGYVDEAGAWVINPQFEEASSFLYGLAPAKQGGKWGFIDKKGVWAIAPTFDTAGAYNGLYAPVTYEAAEAYVMRDGKILYHTEACGSSVLKDMRHYIVWPPLEKMPSICMESRKASDVLVKY